MKQVSLFSGVGAFELAGQEKGIKTVLSCELDKYACNVLRHHFKDTEVFQDDVRKLRGSDIVSRYGRIDIITAGFPCQSFSIAGKREGFKDATRGTLFFEVVRLASEIRPDYIILENVKGLFNHENGKTFGIILESLNELGYDAEWQVLNSKYFGVPQNRERVFIIGHIREKRTQQIFPIKKENQYNNENAVSELCGSDIQTCFDVGMSEGTRRSIQSGIKIRDLTPLEYERAQSFPDNFTNIPGNNDNQRYKQMGNSITVNVLREIYGRILP